VSRASNARRLAIAAAYGGGGLSVLTGAAFGLIRAQAAVARRTIGEPTTEPPVGDGLYGRQHVAAPIHFAVLGDSSACGFGVDHPHQTPGAMMAAGLAECAYRPVQLRVVAAVGSRSSDLNAQITRLLAQGNGPFDVAVIMIGANDVTHRVRPATAVLHLDQAVRRLRDLGTEVVVGTCPDLGTIEPVPQPLRWIARRSSRSLAAAQTIAVVEAGARSVSLGDILGPEFAASPAEMFGPDRFHPSVAGYASAASVLLPSVCASIGVWIEATEEALPDLRRGEGVRPVAVAAVEAADRAGTEVGPAQVGGADRGPRGRWALLRRRRGQAGPDVAAQAAEDARGQDDDPDPADGSEALDVTEDAPVNPS
jgi:lysophospholipase L1-like esterase